MPVDKPSYFHLRCNHVLNLLNPWPYDPIREKLFPILCEDAQPFGNRSIKHVRPPMRILAAEIQKIGLKFTQMRRNLESELQKGLRELQSLNTKAATDREPIKSQIQMLIKGYSQAKADLEATPKT